MNERTTTKIYTQLTLKTEKLKNAEFLSNFFKPAVKIRKNIANFYEFQNS